LYRRAPDSTPIVVNLVRPLVHELALSLDAGAFVNR